MSIRTVNVPLADIPALVFPALGDTLIMVGIVMVIVVLVGIPLGALVHNLAPGGLFENPPLHTTISWVVSIGRSLPFLILMASIVPFTRFITGTNIGIAAAVVPMSIAGIAFFTRIVENSLRSVPPTLVRVAKASGASPLQIIRTAQLNEALPSIIGGLTINTIAMIEYSAHRRHHRRRRHRLCRRHLRLPAIRQHRDARHHRDPRRHRGVGAVDRRQAREDHHAAQRSPRALPTGRSSRNEPGMTRRMPRAHCPA
jgi:ABC-type methionine transport system permease subunit